MCELASLLIEAEAIANDQNADVIALNEALKTLATFDERKSRIVELRFFGGLTEEEAAEVLKIPLRTLQREWSLERVTLQGIMLSLNLTPYQFAIGCSKPFLCSRHIF